MSVRKPISLVGRLNSMGPEFDPRDECLFRQAAPQRRVARLKVGSGPILLKNSRLIDGPLADSIPLGDRRIGNDGTAARGATGAVL